jgi:hypothetical protein
MISGMEAGMSAIRMGTSMKGNSRKVKLMAKEFITGTLGRYLMENGKLG